MATKGNSKLGPKTAMDEGRERAGFDVLKQQVVGHVTIGEGDLNADEAAFLVIARAADPGVYSFPGPDEGSEIRVEVSYTGTSETPDEAMKRALKRILVHGMTMDEATDGDYELGNRIHGWLKS